MFKWGVDSEAGCLMQSQSRSVTSDKKPIKDHIGDVVAKSFYNFSAGYQISAYPTGASLTGILSTAVGAIATLVGLNSGHGVTTGLILCEDVEVKNVNEDYQLIDLNLMQHAALTS